MPSFDVMSEASLVEVRNALDQANKEIGNRFDFKGSNARIEHKERELTAFADYKVPQVLRGFGVLDYTVDLARRIDERRLIPMGSPEEVEIRAATVWACEWIRQELGSRGTALQAFEVDWTLWQAGQSPRLAPTIRG